MKVLIIFALLVVGCSSEGKTDDTVLIIGGEDTAGADAGNADTSDPETDGGGGEADATPDAPTGGAAALIGTGDGSVDSVAFTEILGSQGSFEGTDLEFNPEDDSQLWIVQRRPVSGAPCTSTVSDGCANLPGYATIITNPGEPSQDVDRREDPNSWHFLRRPPAMAFGAAGTWATCGEARTGNFTDSDADFIGPSLWSSDLNVFAVPPGPGLNGSHLDMLHATPFCVGIAHEVDNIYWTFNGQIGALDKYDFGEDHGPGADDHSDGIIFRYATGELRREANIPSGMHYDSATEMLYVVDTGNDRVIALDTTSGTRGGTIEPVYEPLADQAMYEDAVVTEVVAEGELDTPSGLVMTDGTLYITENATGTIHAFDMDGNAIRTLATPFGASELSGITLGPDGKLYIVSLVDSTVYRIDP